MLMIAESKKNAIDDELIKDEQQCEYDRACNWATETMDKLSFWKTINAVLKEVAHMAHSSSIQMVTEQLRLHWLLSMIEVSISAKALLDTIQISLSKSIGTILCVVAISLS